MPNRCVADAQNCIVLSATNILDTPKLSKYFTCVCLRVKVRLSDLRDSGNSHSTLMEWQHLLSEFKGQAVLVWSVFALTEVQKTLLLDSELDK